MTGRAAERPHDGPRFGGLSVPAPEFADDDGSADPVLVDALARHQQGASIGEVVGALHGRRLMVPLLAVLDSLDEADDADHAGDADHARDADDTDDADDAAAARRTGPGEKDSHMATVSLVGADGRRGLLAFTCVAALAAWDAAARGIPASAQRVAAAALDEGADAVLLDVAGPHPCALDGPALRAVATAAPGWTPPWEDDEVRAAVDAALAGVPGLAGHRLLPGQAPAGETAPDILVALLVAAAAGVDAPDAAAVAQAAADRLAADPVLAARCPVGVGLALG